MSKSKRTRGEGHQVTWRRLKILELIAGHHTERELSQIMKVSPATITSDIQFLNAEAKKKIQTWLEDKIPLEYESSLILIRQISKKAQDIADKSDDDRVKLQALSLVRDLDVSKRDLLTGSHVINSTVEWLESTRLKILQSQTDLKSEVAVVTSRLEDIDEQKKQDNEKSVANIAKEKEGVF